MAKIDLEDRGRALEEHFFQKEQRKQVEALRAKKQRGEAITAMRSATGVTDPALLEQLVDLGVSAPSLSAFALVPLAHVAWADGDIKQSEREAILQAAHDRGIADGSPADGFLRDLLAAQPAGALMDAWEAFVVTLRDETDSDAFAAIAGDVAERARDVAKAAGGILGIGSVSEAEQAAIARIEAALN